VLVKHFEAPTDAGRPGAGRRLETRLLVVDRRGLGYGVTYRWRPDGSDAELLRAGLTEEVSVHTAGGAPKLTWSYPSRQDCLACHTASAGFVLGVKQRQLNRNFRYAATGVTDNQLRTWNHLGLFTRDIGERSIDHFDRLAAVTDRRAPLEQRVRSYLDANCAHCHRPGGARGLFDARYDTPLGSQGLINGTVAAADLGLPDAKLIVPGERARSMIYQRMQRRTDVFNMPPLASRVPDRVALEVLAAWIDSLAAKGKGKARDRSAGP
jgi:hypothetical protein